MSWGDEVDEELQQKQEIKVGFPISFKSMINLINLIVETQKEWDEHTPRNSFRRIWAGALLMLFIFFTLTYNVLALATLIFIGFYGYVLIKLGKAYKFFGYSTKGYIATTIVAVALLAVAAFLLQGAVLG